MSTTNEKMLWDQTWKSYESSAFDYARNVEGLYPHKEAERFLSLIPSGGTIIDIGCGSGRDVKKFSDRGFHVTGIDFSPSMIEIATSNAPKATFKIIDVQSFDLEENFDAAWANASLLHIPKIHLPKVKVKSELDAARIQMNRQQAEIYSLSHQLNSCYAQLGHLQNELNNADGGCSIM